MMNIATVTEFLGWCSVINYSVLAISTVMLIVAGDLAKRVHGKLFNLSDDALNTMYFNFLGYYKLAIFIFNLAPYIALKIMA